MKDIAAGLQKEVDAVKRQVQAVEG
jgi:hypothetical protein